MGTLQRSTEARRRNGGLPGSTARRLGARVLLVIASSSTGAAANSRAPRTVAWIPSTAPRAVSPDVVAEHETLTFRCDEVRCQVRAAYRVRAGSAQQVELRFVAPIKAPVTARFGTSTGTVSFVRADALKAEIDEDAWNELYGTVSRPFARPSSGQIAIKVINDYGDEVLKVFDV